MSAFDAYANAAQLLPTQSDPYAALAAYSQFSGPLVNFSPAYSAASIGEEIRTIFITGFPPDVKERELNNLLRFLHGYKASQMNWKNGQAQGFALFDSNLQARTAVESITQLVFDESYILRCEMARKNMFIKEEAFAAKRDAVFGSGYLPSQYGGLGFAAAAAPVRPQAYGQITNVRDNPPCNTLFIGNLSDNVDENELRGLFSTQPGFRQMKLVHGDKGTNCFVEFMDVASASNTHQMQQGAILTSSDRGPIRIQYSKNPFGKKREDGMFMSGMSSMPSMPNPTMLPPFMNTSPRMDIASFNSSQFPSPTASPHII
eukprot:TRINITY_DN3166_c1_g1_i2.p1 TRINITY_DN3166_c1_g1~~TRINITY_DN3166_c1_g1_i2.p1  ORF type:complete len:317 (+),score=71.80 TRINITY_DN3166_c1_g1_i2:189-1139(+)